MRLRLLSTLLLLCVTASVPTFADPSQAGLIGYCSIGGEPIADYNADKGRFIPSANYRLLNCTYTNGQTAKVAVCDQHRYEQPASVYPIIWEAIKRGWAADMDKTEWPRARREKYWAFYEGVAIQSCDE